MRNIAIIPARCGSKGLKDKNIKRINGKPLIGFTIEAAKKSGEFDEIMVSTDSKKYAEIAISCGAKVPFLRSALNSSDSASSWDMVDEVLNKYERIGESFDTFCLLQPTSPLRDADDIKKAYELFRDRAKYAVISVCEAEHSPLWCGHLPDNHELKDFISQDRAVQRQASEKYYRLNGAIYIVNVNEYLKDKNLYKAGSFAYIMSQKKSIDIDTDVDFTMASIFLGDTIV